MKYLIVSGCSFTSAYKEYVDLNDNYDFKKWPEILRDKLCPDAKLINVAFSGAGNDYILHSLINKLVNLPKQSEVLCIAAWTGCTRESWITESKGLGQQGYDKDLWIHDNITHDLKKGKVEYYRKSSAFCAHTSNVYRYMLGKFCNELNVNLVDFNMLEDSTEMRDDPFFKFINPNQSLFETYDSIFKIIPELNDEKFKIAKDDRHPNLDGHKLIAERVYNEIQRMGY